MNLSIRLCSIPEHIIHGNAVTAGRIVQKHVRDRTDEFTVLNDRASAHPLHDTARLRQKRVVCNFDHEIFVLLIIFIDLDNTHGVFFRRDSVDGRKNARLARMRIPYGSRLCAFESGKIIPLFELAENAAIAVLFGSRNVRVVQKYAFQFARFAADPFDDVYDAAIIDLAARDLHRRAVFAHNGMPQRTEPKRVFFNVRDRSDARYAVSHEHAEFAISARDVFGGFDFFRHLLAASLYFDGIFRLFFFCKHGIKIFRRFDGNTV